MKIRLSDLRRIIKEEVSRSLKESYTQSPEEMFKRAVATAPEHLDSLAAAWDSLKSGEPFADVAQRLYDETRLNITHIAKTRHGGPGLGLENIDPEKLAAVESMIDASTMTGDDLLTHAAAEQERRSGLHAPRPPSDRDPNDPYRDVPYIGGGKSGARYTGD
jgi:hypothetical protein